MTHRIKISDASMRVIQQIKEYYKEYGEQLREDVILSDGSTADIVWNALLQFEGYIEGVCCDFSIREQDD